MSETDKEQEKRERKQSVVTVCGFCAHHDTHGNIELNAIQKTISFMCSGCGKMNHIDLAAVKAAPYPRGRCV